jgi:uncharacterized protein YbjT (DUF2867 family)
MCIIMGATGHVGSAVASELLADGEPVTVVIRDPSKANKWRALGASVAIADILQVEALRTVFRSGARLFLLNPPAHPSTDTDAVERKTIRCLLNAIDGSGLERIVACSTAGARAGERCGDLTTLFELEQGLRAQPIPSTIIRAAYYMSNWDGMVAPARETVELSTMLPVELKIPMVAPADVGREAARLLQAPLHNTGIHHVEGPARYSPTDVAAAFSRALRRSVAAKVIPRDRFELTYRSLGFSAPAARSYTCMTTTSIDSGFEMPQPSIRGSTTIESYVAALVTDK